MKAHQKDIFFILCEIIRELKNFAYEQENDKYRNLLQELSNAHHMFTLKGEEYLKNQIKEISISWSGEDEEAFNNLKILRMKAFGTI